MALEKSTLTEKNGTAVYQETIQPKKSKRRDKSDLGTDFIAPDGGWGWVVCLAAGFSNFSIFPAFQQYGFIYRQRMLNLGFDAKQTTTIINIVMAMSSLVGIVNGAMFRRFTFRQVAIAGSLLCFIGVFSSAFCTTFVQYLICFSAIYGIGLALCMAATSLAVNTYFKLRRRRATGFSWTVAGLGPIIFPHISTFFLAYYGAMGTILLYSGLTLNALLCALTLQPVLWHAKKPEKNGVKNGELSNEDLVYECRYCQHQRRTKRSIFSSQYLFNDDDAERPGYEITAPGTPMLRRANDGWYSSKMTLDSDKGSKAHGNAMERQLSHRSQEGLEKGMSDAIDEDSGLYKPNYFNRERGDLKHSASKTSGHSKATADELLHCTCAEEKALMEKTTDKELAIEQARLKEVEAMEEVAKQNMTFGQKIVKFFDLDLLKDITFVNLALGIAIITIGGMNFSVLTPFILNSYGYSNPQISLAMSLLAGMDILVRFLAPFALEKVKLGNRVLFALGIICISVGRFIVTLTDSFVVVAAAFLLIGFGKGLRTIFSSLIIPSYVPLKRLPAATGLQLVCNAIVSLTFGPLLGVITDATSYTWTIHFINALTATALLLWLIEAAVRKILGKKPIAMDPN